jgi:hypothetical protein
MRRTALLAAGCLGAAALAWQAWRASRSDGRRNGRDQQPAGSGAGPLVHRLYEIDIRRPRLSAEQLMQHIQAHMEVLSPRELARFRKIRGTLRRMTVGDEFDIKIFGPWNGNVRVSDVSPTSFGLVTLEGHPEAGAIRFDVMPSPTVPGGLRFSIESLARNRDQLVRLTYREGVIGQKAQRHTWVTFCKRVAKASGGRPHGRVEVLTEELTRD